MRLAALDHALGSDGLPVVRHSHRSRFAVLLAFMACVCLARPALANWAATGNIVAGDVGAEQIVPTSFDFANGTPIASDGSGGCFVAYSLPGGTSLRINHLRGGTGDGRLWGPQGVAVNPGGIARGPARLAPDGAGGCWVVWEDTRSGSSVIYLQRFSGAGFPLSAETGGRAVGSGSAPLVAPGADFAHVLIAYGNAGLPRVTRLELRGNGDGTATEIDVALSSGLGSPLALFSDGANGGVVVWAAITGASSPFARSIGANRFASNGARLWGADGAVVAPLVDGTFIFGAQAAWDGTSLFVAWTPFLGFAGVPSLPGGTLPQGIRAQKLNSSGVPQLGSGGLSVLTRVDNSFSNYGAADLREELGPRLALDGAGGVWIAWSDSRDFNKPGPNGFPHAQDLYAQHLDGSGAPQLPGTGAPVDDLTGAARDLHVAPGIGGDLLVAYRSFTNSPPSPSPALGDIFAARVRLDGTHVPGPFILTQTYTGSVDNFNQLHPRVASDGAGGFFVAWDDLRVSTNQDVFVTHRTGTMGLDSPPPSIVADRIAMSVSEGGTASFNVRLTDPPPDGEVLVTSARFSGDPDLTVVSGTQRKFTTANWNVFQSITLGAALDNDSVNGSTDIRCTAPGLASADVIATELDAGPPRISINDISVSTFPGRSTGVAFTVSLNHPSDAPTSVTYATSNGTARAQLPLNPGQYFATSGTLTIPATVPPGAPSVQGTIPVLITGFGSGAFFMNLSQPVNGSFLDAVGQCTIHILSLPTGTFSLSPANARPRVGETVRYALTWTVPDNEVWRNLQSLDFRLNRGGKTALWLHWDEPTNAFSLCREGGKDGKDDEADDGAAVEVADEDVSIVEVARGRSVACDQGQLPGSPGELETPYARVDLANCSVVGSGPTGHSVTLNLAIIFQDQAAGHQFGIQLAAADDFGHQDGFVNAGRVRVIRGDEPVVSESDLESAPASTSSAMEVQDEARNGPALAMTVGASTDHRTSIEYSLPAASEVLVNMYDLAGRRVATLEHGAEPAGTHALTWDTSTVPHGLYFCRIWAGAATLSRSVLVLK
jgi:hypothetical protein